MNWMIYLDDVIDRGIVYGRYKNIDVIVSEQGKREC